MERSNLAMKKIIAAICIVFMLIGALIFIDTPISGVQNVSAAVKINKDSVTIDKGKKIQLNVLGTKKKVKWSSNAKSVATVNNKGLVTGKKKGTAIITAKTGNKKYTCKVIVKDHVVYYSTELNDRNDDYKSGIAYKCILKDNELIVYGSFRKSSSRKAILNSKGIYCKDKKRIFKLSKKMKIYGRDENEKFLISRKFARDIFKNYVGMGVDLKVVNGYVTRIEIYP